MNESTHLTSTEQSKPTPSPESREQAKKRVSTEVLSKFVARKFVRSKNHFFLVDQLRAPLTLTDVKRISMQLFARRFPNIQLDSGTLRDIFQRALVDAHTDPTQSVPIWNGSTCCVPNNNSPIIWDGEMVSVNTWQRPSYRLLKNISPDFGMFDTFLATIFPHETDRLVCKDWLSFCLQNEADKPGWALFLYSRRKGTGKSTLCTLFTKLFGTQNLITQNSIAKLTGRFNKPILDSNLVISEELQLRPESPPGNTLKTYITEKVTVSEVKGREVEKVKQCCCFLFTTNHLPLWIEADERRYYVIDVDHSGHASGPDAEKFSQFIVEFNKWMGDDQNIAGLYMALMEHRQSNDFNAHSLNLSLVKTPVMQQIMGNSREVLLVQLEEHIAALGCFAIPLNTLTNIFTEKLKTNSNRIRHMLPELGWRSETKKWGAVDHDRTVWIHPDYQISQGRVIGPWVQ